MAKSDPNVNPFSHSGKGATGGTGGVNPSGPTSGTEGWGLGDGEHRTTASPEKSAMPNTDQGKMRFNCSEIHSDCKWQATGDNEQEIRSKIEQHGRERHNLKEMTEDVWNKIRASMHRTAA